MLYFVEFLHLSAVMGFGFAVLVDCVVESIAADCLVFLVTCDFRGSSVVNFATFIPDIYFHCLTASVVLLQ